MNLARKLDEAVQQPAPMAMALKPLKLKTGRLTVTPDIARQILEHNTSNRPISKREVERLKRVLESGEWRYNGEPVKISKSDRLLDGQHRLIAIAESGVSADLFLIIGLEDEVFTTLDQGRKRTGGDVLFMRGAKRYNALSVSCSMLFRMVKNRPIYGAVDQIPAYGIDKIFDRHPGLAASIEFCAPLHGRGDTAVAGLGYLAAFHYAIETIMGEPEKAASFVQGLTTGAELPEDSPLLKFRQRVLGARSKRDIMHAQAKVAMLAKVAGLHVTDQTVKYLTQPSTSASFFTLIPGLKDAIEALPAQDGLVDLAY